MDSACGQGTKATYNPAIVYFLELQKLNSLPYGRVREGTDKLWFWELGCNSLGMGRILDPPKSLLLCLLLTKVLTCLCTSASGIQLNVVVAWGLSRVLDWVGAAWLPQFFVPNA